MPAIKTYNRNHVLKTIGAHGIRLNGVCLMDAEYVYLDATKAEQFFWELSMQVISTLQSWQENYRDCDKYSRVVQALGQMSHALQWGDKQSKPAGLALGVFNYVDKKIGPHSINCAIVKTPDKDEFKLKFFEPQSAKEIALTPAEIQSTFLILL
jgi:hypothetical protein